MQRTFPPCAAVGGKRRAVEAYAAKLEDVIAKGGVQEQDLPRIAFTLQTGREALRHRVAFVAETLSDLKAQLGSFIRATCWMGWIAADIKLCRIISGRCHPARMQRR